MNALAIPDGKGALPGCSVEFSACARIAVGLGLSRCQSVRQYLGRRRGLSSRFKQESWQAQSGNLDANFRVLLAVSAAAVFPNTDKIKAWSSALSSRFWPL